MNSRRNAAWIVRLVLISVCTLAGITSLVLRTTRTYAQNQTANHVRVPMTTDWSNRHMVYSAPSSMMQAWRLQVEPRYLHQWTRRNAQVLQDTK